MKDVYPLIVLSLVFTFCIFIPPRAAEAETSAEAEQARKEFETRCPRPDWWGRIDVSGVRIDTYDDLIRYWQDRQRSKSEFFKAAYQAILDYPLDTDIVVTAINLMNSTSSYRHRIELQEYAVDKYFTFNSVHGKYGDTIGGIVENLARLYNNASAYDKTVRLIERLLNERGREINDHLLELITMTYAEALHGQHRTDRAISVLADAIQRYNGSWEEELKKQLARYQSSVSQSAVSEPAPPVHKTGSIQKKESSHPPAARETTPLVFGSETAKPGKQGWTQSAFTFLIVFFLLLILRNIVRSRMQQKPSRRY